MTIATAVDTEAERRFGEQIRRARLIADIDQQTLAARANISVGALRNLEGGKGSRLVTVIGVLRALRKEAWLDTLEPEQEPGPFDEVYGRREPKRATARRREGT